MVSNYLYEGKPLVIMNCPVMIDHEDGPFGRIFWTAKMDVDGDGPHKDSDPTQQSQTSLRLADGSSIDSFLVPGIVIPPQIAYATQGTLLGCKAQVKSRINSITADAVVYDIGPKSKIGEASVAACKIVKVNSDPNTGGDRTCAYEYSCWPGIAATVNGVLYPLRRLG